MAVTQIPGKQIGPLDLTTEVTGVLPVANGGTGGTNQTGKLLPVRYFNDASETYTIVGGTVTQISGTTFGGASPAVGDRLLISSAPAATGLGTWNSTQPGNGIYVVTSNTTNLSLTRATDFSGSVSPSGLSVAVTDGWLAGWAVMVTFPSNPGAAFTFGTDAISWSTYGAPNVATVGTAQTFTTKTIDGANNTLIVRAADIPNGLTNNNTARQSQVTAINTSYYITNSNLNLPATLKTGMAVGTKFVWRVAMDKTAAGTGTFSIVIYRGTNGTTADTADVTQSIGTQTAVIDNMVVDVELVVTTTGATGAYYWTIIPVNTISSTTTAAGFGIPKHTAALLSGTVSSVALNTASLKFGLGFRNGATGTPTITVPMVQAQAFNIS